MRHVKFYDISRELTTAPVYPGDPAPQLSRLSDMALGDAYTASQITMSLHNGTHVDAPCHFFPDADDVTAIPLTQAIGECRVVECDGVLLGDEAERIMRRVGAAERILFKGTATLSQNAAFVLADAGVRVIGVESDSVAPAAETAVVHRALLSEHILLLENLDLSAVEEGTYFLFAAPVKIAGADGAPVRAVLVER